MPRRRRKPAQKDMVRAYEAAKEGKMSIREAARKFNVPKSTLIDKVNGKSMLICKKGPKPVLTPGEEKNLAEWGVRMAGIGYTSIKNQIMYTVKTILDKDEKEGRGREKRFGDNNLPGKDWWGRFCERHPKLKKASGQASERAKKLVKSDAALCKWKSTLKRFMQKQKIKDASCLFTCTANRFLVEGHQGEVKYCHSKKTREGAKYLTILTASSADGKFVPPMIVYPGDHTDIDLLEDEAVDGTFFTKSRNGGMNVELFYSWIGNHFLDYTPPGKAILLLIEGGWPFIDMYVSRLCKDKNIILYCMPLPSNLFQEPLTWGFSKLLPNEWKKEYMNFEILNPGMKVDRYTFPAVFGNVWTNLASSCSVRAAFERSGIWPSDTLNKQKAAVEPPHAEISCYDEDGNEIEVAMYEEVISEHPAVGLDVEVGNENRTEAESSTQRNDKETQNVLKQFEESQGLSDEQKEVFEARHLLDFEGQHDLVYNAWKALKELIVMKEDTTGEYDTAEDEEEDDDDSLLGWLSDESDDDVQNIENEKENIDSKDNHSGKGEEDVDDRDDGQSQESEESEDEKEEEEELELQSSSSNDSSQELSPVPSRASPARTTMSPLKISRYVYPGAADKRKKRKGLSAETRKRKKRKQTR